MKEPVGLERLQSGANLLFIERGLPTQLVPNRDVGVQLHGKVWGNTLAYQVGYFNGVEDGGSGDIEVTDDGKDPAARLFVHPFDKGGNRTLEETWPGRLGHAWHSYGRAAELFQRRAANLVSLANGRWNSRRAECNRRWRCQPDFSTRLLVLEAVWPFRRILGFEP
jgi:hypothetical protein